MSIGLYVAAAAAGIVYRVGLEYSFGLPLAYQLACQVASSLTVADWVLFAAIALATAVQCVRLSKAKGAPVADAAPSVARPRTARIALAPGTDPVSVELEACLERASAGAPRAPLQLLGSLHAAGVVRPAHVARVLSAPATGAQIRDALKFAQLAKVVLDNDAVVAVITGLCDMDAGDTALEVWRSVAGRDYYLPLQCLDALLTAAMRYRAFSEAEELFQQMKCVGTPSARAYAAAIFAQGCRGHVAGCLDRYEELQVEHADDPSPAWNSLLVSLVRNGCSGRAAQLFAEGRDKMSVLPVVWRAVHM